jgi:uncharacterized protein YndB with AHSA1/START domain
MSTEVRSTDMTIEIAAPPEVVWKALTDARELMRWFAPEAGVTPGVGGAIWLRWEGVYDGSSRIEVWDPPRHLRAQFPAAGAIGESNPLPIMTDYHLEAKGGGTVLRIVSSGFGKNAEWDEMYDGVRTGWMVEASSLRLYVERHLGRDRAVALARTPVATSRADGWRLLTGAGGWLPLGPEGDVREGTRFDVRTRSGERLVGRVLFAERERELAAVVENFGDAFLRIALEKGRAMEAWVWLATYDRSLDETRALEERWLRDLSELFPAERAAVVLR